MSLKVAYEFGLSLTFVRTLPPDELALYAGFLQVKYEEEKKAFEKSQHEAKMNRALKGKR